MTSLRRKYYGGNKRLMNPLIHVNFLYSRVTMAMKTFLCAHLEYCIVHFAYKNTEKLAIEQNLILCVLKECPSYDKVSSRLKVFNIISKEKKIQKL